MLSPSSSPAHRPLCCVSPRRLKPRSHNDIYIFNIDVFQPVFCLISLESYYSCRCAGESEGSITCEEEGEEAEEPPGARQSRRNVLRASSYTTAVQSLVLSIPASSGRRNLSTRRSKNHMQQEEPGTTPRKCRVLHTNLTD